MLTVVGGIIEDHIWITIIYQVSDILTVQPHYAESHFAEPRFAEMGVYIHRHIECVFSLP